MGLSNAERQANWRKKRNMLAAEAERLKAVAAEVGQIESLKARIRELEARQTAPAPVAKPAGRKSTRASEKDAYIEELELRNEELEPWATRGPDLEARVKELEEGLEGRDDSSEEVADSKAKNAELEEIERRYNEAVGKDARELLESYEARATEAVARNEALRRWLGMLFAEGWERNRLLHEPRARLLCAMAATASEGRGLVTHDDPTKPCQSRPFDIGAADRLAEAVGIEVATARAILTVFGELTLEQCEEVRERFF
jgi:hypothetical protein